MHGEMCGALAASGSLNRAVWAADWVGNHFPEGDHIELKAFLVELLNDAYEGLTSEHFAFSLKVPDDDELPVVERAQALASWCSGFLSGVGERLVADQRLSADVREVFIDMERIARTLFSLEEAGNDAEADLTELIEYVRVGALLVFEHFRAPTSD